MITLVTIIISLAIGFLSGFCYYKHFLKPSITINCKNISVKRNEKTTFEIAGYVDFILKVDESFSVDGNPTTSLWSFKSKGAGMPRIRTESETFRIGKEVPNESI